LVKWSDRFDDAAVRQRMHARAASEKIDFAQAERQIPLVRLQRPQSSSKEEEQ
jgi:hypothetical protein